MALVAGALLACAGLRAAEESEPQVRLKAARALVDQGKHEEALKEFVWCYDHGVEVDPKFARTRDTRVTLFMVSLGKKYPAARAALIERRDALAKQLGEKVAAAPKPVLQQLASLDLALDDEAAMLGMLAKLPEGKAAYRAYGSVLMEKLVEKKLYKQAVAADDTEFLPQLEKAVGSVVRMRRDGKLDEKGEAKMKASALKAAPSVEMYAGAGDMKMAQRVADLLLTMAPDAEVCQKVVERLRRAGADELAARYEAKLKV